MKRACFICLLLCLTTSFLLSQSNPVPLINQTTGAVSPISASKADPKAQARILDSYGKLPLSFEANHGQTDGRVKFLSRTSGYSLFLTADEAVLALSARKAVTKSVKNGIASTKAGGVLRMKLRNANPAAKVTGGDELAGMSNYFIGNDPEKWWTNIPTYAKVKYEGIYSGIDLVYYGNQRQLEYDFIVAPGADPHRIQFDVRGAKRIRRDEHGEVVFKVGDDEIRWHKPVAYQKKDGARQLVAAHYAITDSNRVRFEVAGYDTSRPLYIDPLIYSTYLGGSKSDSGRGIAVDSAGSAYVTGQTASTDFPTMFPLQPANGGYFDVFVAKLDPSGSALVYSTYLGGSAGDYGYGIAVDNAGDAYVTGQTASTDFPTTSSAFQRNYGGDFDAFVTKLSPTGSALVYSTYLGGTSQDEGWSIAVDSAGYAYVTGGTDSTDFPTVNPLQPTSGGQTDGFVAKINPTGSALVYSTYLGGSTVDTGTGIAIDSSGDTYVTGLTGSANFPTKNALQPAFGGAYDAFVTEINPAGTALVYSTYLGGAGEDFGNGIAVDSAGNAYVTGETVSTNFPTMNPLQPTFGGGYDDAFVTKINPGGSALVYSTYLGGSSYDEGYGIAVDSAGNAYVTGNTNSPNFPTASPLHKRGGGYDAFVAKINVEGSALVYSTYLGGAGSDYGFGIAVDNAGNAYVTGDTSSRALAPFPTTPGAFQTTYGGGGDDAFVAKIMYAPTTTLLTSSVNPSLSGKIVKFTATVSSSSGGMPTGKVTFRNGATVLGTSALSGGRASFSTSTLPPGSNSVTAAYGGDSNFTGSTSAPVNQFVLAATTTTLSSSPNPSTYGQAVVFAATVTSSIGAPPDGETVTFKQGAAVLGTGTLNGGTATFSISTLGVSSHAITAVYGGDSNFGGSTKAVNQVVSKATTTTILTSSLNPSTFGQSVTFTASVTPQFSGTVKGDGELLRWHDAPENCVPERRGRKIYNFDAYLRLAHYHSNVQRQRQLYRQFGFGDPEGELTKLKWRLAFHDAQNASQRGSIAKRRAS